MRTGLTPGPPLTSITLSVGVISRLASLNGLRIGSTCSTPGNGLERLNLQLVLLTDDADDGAHLALAQVRFEAQLADAIQNVIDLLGR